MISTRTRQRCYFLIATLAAIVLLAVVGCNSNGDTQTDFQALAARINDDPDELHFEMTPAVHSFIRIGRPAIPTLLDLMLSPNKGTRMRACAALEGITLEMYGFRSGHGWVEGSEDQWRLFWQELGSLNWKDPEPERRSDIELWRKWYLETSATDASQTHNAERAATLAIERGDFRFAGVMGVELIVPGVPDYFDTYQNNHATFIVDADVTDAIASQDDLDRLNQATEYARRYNALAARGGTHDLPHAA